MFVINGRFLTLPQGGVRRYALEWSRLLGQKMAELQIVAPPDAPMEPGLPVTRVGNLRGHAWEQMELPLYLKRRHQPFLLNLANTAPLMYDHNIIVVHDLAWKDSRLAFHPRLRRGYRFLIPRLVRRAKAVWTVSRFAEAEILKEFPFLKGKIECLPPVLDYVKSWKSRQPQASGLSHRPFFLTVGLTSPRKDPAVLLRAFSMRPERFLVVAGYASRVLKDLAPLPDNVLLMNALDDEVLAWLYAHSQACISASRYEGFDLPPLEAALLGRPVILSDIPVHREIWNDRAWFFPTDEAPALAEILDSLDTARFPVPPCDFTEKFSAESLYPLFQALIARFLKE